MRAILMFQSLWVTNPQEGVHKPQPLWREGRAEAESSPSPSAYQSTALPLGQTGSQVAFTKKDTYVALTTIHPGVATPTICRMSARPTAPVPITTVIWGMTKPMLSGAGTVSKTETERDNKDGGNAADGTSDTEDA